jgi:hypothetical protein
LHPITEVFRFITEIVLDVFPLSVKMEGFFLDPEKILRAAPCQIPPIRYPHQSDNFFKKKYIIYPCEI